MKARYIVGIIASCGIGIGIVFSPDCLRADDQRPASAVRTSSISFRPLDRARNDNARIDYVTNIISLYLSRYGTLTNFERVMNLAANPYADRIVRIAALRACFTQCQGETKRAVVDRFLSWTIEFDNEYLANGLENFGDQDHTLHIFSEALKEDNTIDSIVEIVSSDEQGKAFFEWMMTSDYAIAIGSIPARELLPRVDLPRSVKEEYAIGRIRSRIRRGNPTALIPFLPVDAEAQLLEIVRSTDDDYYSVNKFALQTLAHIGSQAVRDYLVANRESFRITLPIRYSEQGPEGERSSIPIMIDYWISMVDMQQTNESLLAYIEAVDWEPPMVLLRPWAVTRAMELQIDTEQILSAIHRHRKRLEKEKKCADGRKLWGLRYAELELRTAVVRAGLMGKDEWPSPFDTNSLFMP